MLNGTFVTVTGFKHYKNKSPFSIGSVLLCCKEPENPYDTEAIQVFMEGGDTVGYIANGAGSKANGTMSAARIYDRVGDYFTIEVCFSTQTKIICQVTCPDVRDEKLIRQFTCPPEDPDDDFSIGIHPCGF